MITRVCNAPVNTYFDITPIGVILNRFSKDIQTVEMMLPFTMIVQLINCVTVISGMAVAVYNVIWIFALAPFMLIACLYLFRYYSFSLKEITRLESISNSPIISHISETISGASTIRTFDKTDFFIQKEYFLQDRKMACQLIRRGIK